MNTSPFCWRRGSAALPTILVLLLLFTSVGPTAEQPWRLTNATAPNVRTVTTSAVSLFSTSRGITKMVQNNGTVALLYRIGAAPTASSYHGVIAGGAALRDGLGTSVDFSNVDTPVYVLTESGSTEISVVELSP